jgi:3'-phosphoadenosine 5'-phosphosulfate (PAPS) 3'-phosphatase
MTGTAAKIFGLGLSKTGTTSLANALEILGYKTRDNMGVVKYARGDLSSLDLETVDAHEALTDTPIPSFFRELDARYPNSKFILTVRDAQGWLTSCRKQFTPSHAATQCEAHRRLFTDLYGSDAFDEEGFAAGYRKFVGEVRDFFRDRPQDLLIINVVAGEGWEKLCPFLGQPIPDIPFPKANVTRIRWMGIEEVVAVAIQAGRELIQHYAGELPAAYMDDREAPPAGASRFLTRAMRATLGQAGVRWAVRATNRIIVKGLTKLNPHVPVMSRAGDLAPFAERRTWNHLWLVDPLDGERAFAAGSGGFSINIALIEDGQPIYGVVYAPALATIYYGRANKDCYRRTGKSPPVPLHEHRPPAPEVPIEPFIRLDANGEGSSRALVLCGLSEVRPETALSRSSMEWHTAAAHAVLSAAGFRIYEGDVEKELRYNKRHFANGMLKIT